MSIEILEKYIPENASFYLKKWFRDFRIHIKITKNRESKLGDYRPFPDGSHQITINYSLEPELFFLVLTHELAHLLAFEDFGKTIFPHGKEWKITYKNMLLESLSVYKKETQPLILRFSQSPKANFMASPELVTYFYGKHKTEDEVFINELELKSQFIYRNKKYILLNPRKKNYLCENLDNGRQYLFKGLVKVQKIN